MSKIDIDKFFREQFRAHEQNSGTCSPEHWKNFEQLLDKQTKKRNNWGFSLNNLLFFMSSFVLVMLIPMLFLHSDTVVKSEGSNDINKNNIEKTYSVTDNTSSFSVDNAVEKIVPASENINCQTAVSVSLQNEITKQSSEKYISEEAQVNNNDEGYILPVQVKRINLLDDHSIRTIIKQQKNKKDLKQTDLKKNNKKGVVHRPRILMPDLYYNGF